MIRPILALALTLPCFGQIAYPRSIVPGGVEPGFAQIYPHAQITGWVNYRDGSEIRWAPATIPAWETVLIDRSGNLVRGRCGNSIALTRPEFVSPPVVDIDTPQVAYVVAPEIFAPLADVVWPETPLPERASPNLPTLPKLAVTYSRTPYAPVAVWIPAGFPLPQGRPVKPGDVPEPGTFGLVLAGLALCALCAAALRRQESPSGRGAFIRHKPHWSEGVDSVGLGPQGRF